MTVWRIALRQAVRGEAYGGNRTAIFNARVGMFSILHDESIQRAFAENGRPVAIPPTVATSSEVAVDVP
jgi:hypothetical protein